MDDVELKTLFTAIGDQSIQILECIFFLGFPMQKAKKNKLRFRDYHFWSTVTLNLLEISVSHYM